jgi:general stress protein CsbA
MRKINKKWFYLLPLIVLIGYVPIKLRGIDSTFWIFSLDVISLGERGIIWHCLAVVRNLNWVYFLLELSGVYLILFAAGYFLHRRK